MDMLTKAVSLLLEARHITAFTGAGVSVESGIPSFRGKDGLWNRYDPGCLNIDRFCHDPQHTWPIVKEIFYDYFGQAKPNPAHTILAQWEAIGRIKCVITQNIDNLHYDAGSRKVWEFHGNSRTLVCLRCGVRYPVIDIDLSHLPPACHKCGGLLKPDFVFFGEGIPEPARSRSFEEADVADVFLVIGTTGEVMPACMIPALAKRNGARIIEINPEYSTFTGRITDVHVALPAGLAMERLNAMLKSS
jgi:NAD-dependent deacetylase